MRRWRARRGGVMVGATLLSACHRPAPSLCDDLVGDPSAGDQRNVLIILSDDIGIEQTAVYGEHPDPAKTPNIDALAADGLLFRNAYANPTCTPSRASLLTGRHGSRTGAGTWIYPDTETYDLPLSEVTIPEMLRLSPYHYSVAAVGKWHLVGFLGPDPAGDPLNQGFDCYTGTLGNPQDALSDGHLPRGYEQWEKVVDGEADWTRRYLITDTTDEAIARLARLPSPWVLYVAYNGAHMPLHVPPRDLLETPLAEDASDVEMYRAMIEATDAEIGRLLAAMDVDTRRNTTIFYASDNGTPGPLMVSPSDPNRAKGTLYEGGVNVPLIVTGPHVAAPGTETEALVHFVDLLPTIAEIAEVDLDALVFEEGDRAGEPVPLDGLSLLPVIRGETSIVHEYLYTESFKPNGFGVANNAGRMIRDDEWKLTQASTGAGSSSEQLFRLDAGVQDEGENVYSSGEFDAEAEEAGARLEAALAAQIAQFEAER